ncbi:YihY/virulence factor BrkB family protein [Solicola sp. PLA-1-18]|uniref:YihY/virulence factor BrkB family protein n=1 Tax=Solicola sp. PLA-1-18 TaxID=3380532 RepID=UPI003B81F211
MSAEAGARADDAAPAPSATASRWREARHTLWRIITGTVASCFRYRVTGLAAEAAFFAILSLPPLIFGLAGSVGYVANRFQVAEVDVFKDRILDIVSQALTPSTVEAVIEPTLDDVLRGGRIDVISIGFVLALWSGSRALNVFIDTITIMYGLGGRRGIVKTRALSFALYVVALLLGIVLVPLILAGPTLVDQFVPESFAFVARLYWPTVLLLSIVFLTTLYHLSVPVRTSWWYDLPGAVLTLTMWILGSWAVRGALGVTADAGQSTSIYGPLAAPIAILLWLYVLSISVLIGAALNASAERVFPSASTSRARLELVRRFRERARMPWQQQLDGQPREDLEPELEQVVLDQHQFGDELEERTRRVVEDAIARRARGAEPVPEEAAENQVRPGADRV